MSDLEWGPVEIMLVGFEGEKPTSGVVDAVTELVRSGTVRLLDLLFVSRSADGTVSSAEWEEAGEGYGFAGLELEAPGLAGEEDVEDFAALLPAGATAVLLVIELVWAKNFASQLVGSEGGVIASQRIPAAIVNAAAAIARADTDRR